eukprot:gnl/MRDRNA2_/MRDRNA2_60558_c0_seq2.p1 gnl/MRDRNA2_/MRDRNA2_60558_c0~~gnl/MRDRNA2_/MRDRNA2_60558_c0_seq2.p1  ORF type:complete len:181 (+),score=59.38 gnl/MRDRNA2_/MRDRNA2_60558_c0_seq2:108-650(+)
MKGKGKQQKMMEQMAKMMMMMTGMGDMMGGMGNRSKGRKRKAEEVSVKDPVKEAEKEEIRQRPKNKFLEAVQFIITKNYQRNISKDDVSWVCEEVQVGGGTKYQATVTLSDSIGEEGGKSFTGEPGDSQREAESSAATVAYENMKEIIEPLEEAHKAKKKENEKKRRAVKKAKKAEKEAA